MPSKFLRVNFNFLPKEVNSGECFENDDRRDSPGRVDVLRHALGLRPVDQAVGEEGLLIDQVAKHKGGAGIGETEEGVNLGADAVEEVTAGRPTEDQEAEDELERDAPDDVAPNDPGARLGEEAAKADDEDQAAG